MDRHVAASRSLPAEGRCELVTGGLPTQPAPRKGSVAASILKRKALSRDMTVPFSCPCGFGCGTRAAFDKHVVTCSEGLELCQNSLQAEIPEDAGRQIQAASTAGSSQHEWGLSKSRAMEHTDDVLLLPVFEGPVAACNGHTDSPGWLAASDSKLSSRIRGANGVGVGSENLSPVSSFVHGGKMKSHSRFRPDSTAASSPLQPSDQNRAVLDSRPSS